MSRITLFVDKHPDGQGLDVLLSFDGPERIRPVVKTVRHNDVSVGFNEAGIPIFIRVRNAEVIDPVFRRCLDHNPTTIDEQKEVIVKAIEQLPKIWVENDKERIREMPAPEIQLAMTA